MTDDELIGEARRMYQQDGEIEVDNDAAISRNTAEGMRAGAWVAAWVWVPGDDEALDSLNAEMET